MGTSALVSGPSPFPQTGLEARLDKEEVEAIHFALKQSVNRWRSDDPSQHESAPPYRQKLLVEKMEREFYDALKAWER